MKNIIFILIFLFSIFSFQVFPQDFEDDTFPEDLENVVPELDTLVEEGEKKEKQKGQPSGIGMNNTRQRLQHVYGDRHQLHIEDVNEQHTVTLQLNLSE